MKKSISEKEFLKRFISDKTNRDIFKLGSVMIISCSLFAWVCLDRPTMTSHEIWELTFGWLVFFSISAPFLLLIRWADYTNSKISQEKVRKGKIFWDDSYNVLLYKHILGYITVSMIFFAILPDQTLTQRVVMIVWHLGAYAILDSEVRLSRLPPYANNEIDTQ